MSDTVTVREHRRSDGTTVKEHERKLNLKERYESLNDKVDNLSKPQQLAIIAATAVMGLAGAKMLTKFYGLAPVKVNATQLTKPLHELDWADAYDPSVVSAFRNAEFPNLKVLDKLDDGTDAGFFRPEAYKHLQGKSFKETLSNVESAIKGRKYEHSFLIDQGSGEIMVAGRGSQLTAPLYVPPKRVNDANMRLTFTHNHPGRAPYSAPDVEGQVAFNIRQGRAVEPDGTVTELMYNPEKLTMGQGVTMRSKLERMNSRQAKVITNVAREDSPRMWQLKLSRSDPKWINKLIDDNNDYREAVESTYRSLERDMPDVFSYRSYSKVVKRDDVKIEGTIAKVDDEQRQVFGWASVTELNGEPVVDLQNDVMETLELEKAAYTYVLSSRVGGEMHERVEKSKPKKVAELIESMVLTPEKIEKMGLPDTTPHGWWIGFQIGRDETGDKVWDAVKKGKYTGFSIHGLGRRVEKNLDEINKATIQIPQYTRRDGTVVEAHERTIDVDTKRVVDTAILGALSAAGVAIAGGYLKAGNKGMAAAYGAYALLSLIQAGRSGSKTVTIPTNGREATQAIASRASDAISEVAEDVKKSKEITQKEFDEAVKNLAESVKVTPEAFLERLGEFLEGQDTFSDEDLETFLDTFEVQKHLLGRHNQKTHARQEHGMAQTYGGAGGAAVAAALRPSPLSLAIGAVVGADLISRKAIRDKTKQKDLTKEIESVVGTGPGPDASDEEMADFDQRVKSFLESKKSDKSVKKTLGDKMSTRVEFLIEKALEHANSEDELLDNLADITDEVEKMLVVKTDKEEVSKETIIVEQYTRQDGTVVPRHERKISARAAAAIAGVAGAAALASPLGRGARSAMKIGAGYGAALGIAGARGIARGPQSWGRGLQGLRSAGRMTRQGLTRSNLRMGASFGASAGRLAGRGIASGARNAGAAGSRFASRTAQSTRSGLEAAGGTRAFQATAPVRRSLADAGRGSAASVKNPVSFWQDVATGPAGGRSMSYAAGGGATQGGIYGGVVGGAVGLEAQRRQRTQKSLSVQDMQILEKYLGRNLDDEEGQ